MALTTDKILETYDITRHSLNILIEHDPSFIGFLGTDTVWNGRAYIKKHVFELVDVSKEQVAERIVELKAKIKADKKANATDEEIINARKRTLEKHNRKQLKGMLECWYDKTNLYYIDQSIRKRISKLDNIEYIKDKSNETTKILKSKESIKLDVITYADEYSVRVDDSVPIYYLEEGEEIEWEKIGYEVTANTDLLVYRYELNNEVVGVDYKILGYKHESKTEVLETYITHKY